MTQKEIETKVLMLVAEKSALPKESLTMTTNFRQDLGLDSLAIYDLIVALEDTFQMTIPDEEAEKIKTIGDSIGYINKRFSHRS